MRGALRVNSTNLRYFLEVAEEKNVTKAAKNVYISQQALSKHIMCLEKELGISLFERKPRFRLTEAGELVVGAARRITKIEDDLVKDLEKISRHCVKIVAGAGFGNFRALSIFLHPRLKELSINEPYINLLMTVNLVPELYNMLIKGDIDFYIGYAPPINQLLESIPLAKNPLYAVVPDNIMRAIFPDDTHEKVLEFQKHADIDTLLSSSAITMVLQHGRMLRIVEEYSEKRGLAINLERYVDLEMIMNFTTQGYCLTLMPKLYLQHYLSLKKPCQQEHQTYIFPLADPSFHLDQMISYRRGTVLTKEHLYFIQLLEQIFDAPAQENLPDTIQ